ncbi:hypothetical protein DFS34DRAFT_92674 [Phlyctochytrium arcticum]|nr:hypothetical protein DFS34DRAFT_92674 [Phlyctochytrium arcticum]
MYSRQPKIDLLSRSTPPKTTTWVKVGRPIRKYITDTSAQISNPPPKVDYGSTEVQLSDPPPKLPVWVKVRQPPQTNEVEITRRIMKTGVESPDPPKTPTWVKVGTRNGRVARSSSTTGDRPSPRVPPKPTVPASPEPPTNWASPPSPADDLERRRRHQCEECPKAFTTSGHLRRHTRIHSGIKPYHCLLEGCESKFARHDNMMQHYRCHLMQRKTKGPYHRRQPDYSYRPPRSTTTSPPPTSSVPPPRKVAVTSAGCVPPSVAFAKRRP